MASAAFVCRRGGTSREILTLGCRWKSLGPGDTQVLQLTVSAALAVMVILMVAGSYQLLDDAADEIS